MTRRMMGCRQESYIIKDIRQSNYEHRTRFTSCSFKPLANLFPILLVRSHSQRNTFGHRKASSIMSPNGTNGTKVETRTLEPNQMQYRFLGRTGLKVSALSFGSWVTGKQTRSRLGIDLSSNI